VSGSRAGHASLKRGTGYMCGDEEFHGICAKCGKYIDRFAWQKRWVHEHTGQPTCDPRDIEMKGLIDERMSYTILPVHCANIHCSKIFRPSSIQDLRQQRWVHEESGECGTQRDFS